MDYVTYIHNDLLKYIIVLNDLLNLHNDLQINGHPKVATLRQKPIKISKL